MTDTWTETNLEELSGATFSAPFMYDMLVLVDWEEFVLENMFWRLL
jgi:hypothetical protein